MKLKPFLWRVFLTLGLSASIFAQKTEFNADSAYAYTHHLSVTIGPRPMGSFGERAALRWTVDRFKHFGADTAYVMPFYEGPGGVNTTSGIAIGIFRGQSDSTIVIGGHIDSDSRYNPGASDNASGTATVIELARNWSRAPGRRYTLLFAAFGGEEKRLVGSEYFAKNYPEMNQVMLMFSIDMASTPGWLIPFIDSRSHQAPRWLVEDAFAVDRSLGYNSLEYPTHFFSLNSAMEAAGSDHLPFLKKGIPAIDFTAGINIDPIHTPQDQFRYVDKRMLARSGRLVDRLMEKYQINGIPEGKKDNYVMWETYMGRIFIPRWLLFVFVALSLALGVGAVLQTRKFSAKSASGGGILSGVKLFLLMIVIAAFTQFGEAGLQLVKQLRYPWMSPFQHYMIYAAIWTLAGVWVALQVTRFWHFSKNPFSYALRAAVILLIYTALLLFVNVRLAAYPALALILLYLVINLRPYPLQLLMAFIMPLPLLRLMFFETLPFLARSLTQIGFRFTSFNEAFIYSLILTALLTLWMLPMLFTWGFVVRLVPAVRAFAGQLRRPLPGLLILLAVVGYGGYLYGLPSYTDRWKSLVQVKAVYDMDADTSGITIRSNEFLRGLDVTGDNLRRRIDDDIHSARLPLRLRADWLRVSGGSALATGAKDTVAMNWRFGTTTQWHRAELTVTCDSGDIEPLIESLNYARIAPNQVKFVWEADPATALEISGRLVIPAGASLSREWIGVYPIIPTPLTVTSEYGAVFYQTNVFLRDTLRVFTGETLVPMDSLFRDFPDSLQMHEESDTDSGDTLLQAPMML